MSKSVNELLKGLAIKDIKPREDVDLYNPDIPAPDDKKNIKDQYYNTFKLRNQPRNGTFALSDPRDRPINKKLEDWQIEGAIDPNEIRRKTDPDTALPSLSSGGMFSLMPEAVQPPTDQHDLISGSINSQFNYANRFKPKSLKITADISEIQDLADPTDTPSYIDYAKDIYRSSSSTAGKIWKSKLFKDIIKDISTPRQGAN